MGFLLSIVALTGCFLSGCFAFQAFKLKQTNKLVLCSFVSLGLFLLAICFYLFV